MSTFSAIDRSTTRERVQGITILLQVYKAAINII